MSEASIPNVLTLVRVLECQQDTRWISLIACGKASMGSPSENGRTVSSKNRDDWIALSTSRIGCDWM